MSKNWVEFSLDLKATMNETKSVTITFEDEGPKTFSYEVDRRDNPPTDMFDVG